MSIQIDHDVPLPPRSDRIPELPLAEMKVGDSFVVPVESSADRATIRQRLYRFQKSNPPVKFSMRKETEESARIFRINDADHE